MRQGRRGSGIRIRQGLRLALFVGVVWLAAGCGKAAAPADAAAALAAATPFGLPAGVGLPVADKTPEAARDFTLDTLDGQSVTLADLKGQWVLVNFWATWCVPCVKEMAYLESLHQTRAMAVLGVNFNEEPDVVRKFVEANKITFPILLAPDDITKMFYGARALPRTVVVAPDGVVAGRVLGEIKPEAFDAWLDAQQVPRR